MSSNEAVYWDPYRPEINANPYPVYQRLREEAPLYHNHDLGFYALSRFNDVEAMLTDKDTFISGKSNILEFIGADIDIPKSMFIWQDPPVHTAYRTIVSRVFTPKRMNELEGKIRAYCVRCLDAKVGAERFDFIADLGMQLPGGVIGMLLGIPDEDRDAVREKIDESLRTEEGKPMTLEQAKPPSDDYTAYIDWRVNHPSDDLMTELLNVEFKDDLGVTRKLTRDEVLVLVAMLSGAGNETTSRLIGWTGKLLGDYPDERKKILENPALVPQAIEEILRMEPPGPFAARYVTRDVEFHGTTVPAGSKIVGLLASANRDEQRFPDGSRLNILRQGAPHITFGRGIHSCLGMALARVEGRVALEEVLKRFPNWTVDTANAKLSNSSTTRGWDSLPVFVG